MSQDVVVENIQEREWKESGDSASLSFTSDVEIRTEAELLAHGEIDTSVWYVKRMTIGSHQVTMKLRQQTGVDAHGKALYRHIPIKKSNWRISAELARIQRRPFQVAQERIIERLNAITPARLRAPDSDRQRGRGQHLIELSLYDAHFGKYCWAPETGEDYDVEIAESVYQNAVSDLIDRVSGYRVSRFVFPIGNDFFHFDNARGTTTSGTPLDCDTRYARVIEHGEVAVVKAILTMLRVAPVDVVLVPGNHDAHSSFHLCRTLKAYFRGTKAVTVNVDPKKRKYYRYGTNVIGYSHGCDEKLTSLTQLMPVEVSPEIWSTTTCREVHVGHLHKTHSAITAESDECNGIRIRTCPSLGATDAWHHAKGYVGNRRSAQSLIYGKNDGFIGLFEVAARVK